MIEKKRIWLESSYLELVNLQAGRLALDAYFMVHIPVFHLVSLSLTCKFEFLLTNSKCDHTSFFLPTLWFQSTDVMIKSQHSHVRFEMVKCTFCYRKINFPTSYVALKDNILAIHSPWKQLWNPVRKVFCCCCFHWAQICVFLYFV